jgi:GT2 family glycosyltransferase
MVFPPGKLASIYIWDNSPNSFLQENVDNLKVFYKNFTKVDYHRSEDNCSLSILYNRVLDQVFGSNSTSVTILDHDSEVAPDFFLEITSAATKSLLVVPKIVSNRTGCLISPRYQASHYFSIRPPPPSPVSLTASGTYSSYDFFAVGSGMTIPRELWKSGLCFDEVLSFYGVDTEFCRDYSITHKLFVIANTILLHDISSEGNENLASFKWRFNSHMDYWSYQLRKYSWIPNFAVNPYVMIWRFLVKAKFLFRIIFLK